MIVYVTNTNLGLSVYKTAGYSLNLVGDFVHIDAAVVGFLLIVTVSTLKIYMNTRKREHFSVKAFSTNISLLKSASYLTVIITNHMYMLDHICYKPVIINQCINTQKPPTLAWTERIINAEI